ncbi:MAG: UDP-N-acetylmuramoyl-L-alanyl-D-glutamate--2,6-diaminopimelate ligase [Defluviitaleaceae bacterium]|nr:UDP-N-acetylmuramoyl-L-alanyl-D-glutamate--2,6-diaminopimelate ligase [Defluviitaleaceae bacterium]
MTLEALLKNVPYEVKQLGNEGILQEISSVTIDSRKAVSGGLFICIIGLTVDGHEYIYKAAKAGASAILMEKYSVKEMWPENSGRVYPRPVGYDGRFQSRDTVSPGVNVVYPPGVTIIEVENTREAMAHIAANYYGHPAEKLSLIGVTGTNGKTTTTHFIEEMLRTLGHKTGIIGTNGARIGEAPIDIPFATSTTPDPMELQQIFAYMVGEGVKYVIMEVSSHALAFFKVEGLTFDVGVFTNLTQDHLDLHGTMDNYRLAKAQLFTQSRFAVVNVDDESTPVMLQHHGDKPYITYGIDKKADLLAIHIEYKPDKTVFELSDEPPGLFYNLHPKGRFNIYNALAAMGTMRGLGLDSIEPGGTSREVMRNAVAKIKGVPGRIQDVPNNLGVYVLVDYAHTPDSVNKIISSVREFVSGRVVIILGCGGDRDKTKRPIMGRIAGEMADYCILTSDNPRTEDPMTIIAQIEEGTRPTGVSYGICENRREAIYAGVNILKPGDALIIAGKGHEDYQIIGAETHYFSDYETAQEALREARL